MGNWNEGQHHIPDYLLEHVMDRFCGSCNKVFTPTNTVQKYCSRRCKEREIKRRQRRKNAMNRAPLFASQTQMAIYHYMEMNQFNRGG